MILRSFLVFLFFLSAIGAGAQSVGDSGRSVRSLGMGGVLIPFVNTADAVFYNPAALKRASALDIKLTSLRVGTNSDTIDNLENIQNLDADDSSTFNDLYGKKMWVSANARTAVSIPLFAFGYMTDYEVSAELNNPSFPTFDTYFRNDEAYYLGSAFEIATGTYFGMSLKRITRWGGMSENLGVADIADSNNLNDIGKSFDNKGLGTGVDIAFLHEVQTPFKPTLTLVWQDVGATAFKQIAGTGSPPAIDSNLTFGAGVSADLPGLDLMLGLEARHLLQTEMEMGKKLYVGAEVSLPMVDIRAGYSQGYLSYGAGLNLFILSLDAAVYQEELGRYPGQSGDQRYMVSLNIDLSFDAEFKFTDNTGKKRKLKQRR